MATSFWAEGPNRLRKGLRVKSRELDRLLRKLQQAGSEDERRSLKEQIDKLLDEYGASKGDLDHSLFIGNSA